ncbi:MAG: energy transducer TonB [Deltaproteobacteria bacterium]|nr:energy transducer TonB [Deltaproteobacteria bacterium]
MSGPSRKLARWRRRAPFFLGLSLAVHLGALLSLPSRVSEAPVVIEIVRGARGSTGGVGATDASRTGEGAGPAAPASRVRLPAVAQSRTSSALDRGEPGASEATGGPISVLLADRDENLTIAEQVPNNFEVTQFQRIATARDRSSLIDDRLTPNPSDDTLLLSGRGRLREMVPARGRNGAIGVAEPPEASRSGPSQGNRGIAGDDRAIDRDLGGVRAMPAMAAEPPPAPGGRAAEAELQRGLANGARTATAFVPGGAVVHTRPDLHEGRPATPSEDRQGRLRDNRWSELLVSTFNHGWVTASDPGGGQGDAGGAGLGGRGAGRDGRGDGGRSAAGAGTGEDTWISLNSPDPRFMAFFRDIHRRVDPLWRNAFPRDAELGLEQGTCIVGFTVHRDGHVSGIHVRRRSGFPEFDRKVQDALRRAAPFGPIPSSLGLDRILVTAPFEFSNPMVR